MAELMQDPQIPTTNTPSKFNLKKVLLTVVAVLVVSGLIGGGVYWYVENMKDSTLPSTNTKQASKSASKSSSATNSAKKDETADWQTYTDNDLNFSVKVPPKWTVGNKDVVVDPDKVKVAYVSSPNNNSLEIDTTGFGVGIGGGTDVTIKTADNKEIKLKVALNDGTPSDQGLDGLGAIKVGSKTYNFTLRFNSPDREKRRIDYDLVKKIISTLKFL